MSTTIDTVAIRLDALKATFAHDAYAQNTVKYAVEQFDITEDTVYYAMLFNDDMCLALDEIRYARQCGLCAECIEEVMKKCVEDNSLQPIKMMYAERGGGTE